MPKALVGHKCVFYVMVERSWLRVIPSRKETEFSRFSKRNNGAVTCVEIPEHYGKFLLLIRLSAPGLWDCKTITDPLTTKVSRNQPCWPSADFNAQTHQIIEADTISLWDTEGGLERSFLWDKGTFDGGWWALDKHEWEAVLGKNERWSMVPSQQWDKDKGAVKANTRNRWVCGNRIRQDRVPVLIPLTKTDSWLRI